jgi:GntR family transcriptional regulator/MocR family aminotransferase
MALRTNKTAQIGLLTLGSPAAGESLQRWLYGALRTAILDGRLPAECILPGTRTLALAHKMARGTVQAAYNQLLSEGYLTSRQGSGTRVSSSLPDMAWRVEPAGALAAQAAEPPSLPITLSGPWLKHLADYEPAFLLTSSAAAPVPFFPHRCDIHGFPMELWRKLHTRHLRASRLDDLWHTDVAGLPALRSAIAQHLGIARGVTVTPDQIVVLGSVQQALDLCLRLLVGPGEQVWMEDPGYPGARQLMLAAGVRVVDIPVDQEGMRVDQGLKLAPSARLAYVTPARQAPLGVALAPDRRLALLRWARENGACIFEDDYDSEYRFVGKPIPALKSLPGGDSHVILAGTFSKLLFPAIRIAFVALPANMVPTFVRAASLSARNANGLTQAVLADFMAEGHFDRHVRRMRRIYASRAQAFEDAARRHWQGLIDVPAAQAGLDVVVRLIGMDEATAMRRLTAAGIKALPLGRYTGIHSCPPALVMGFAPFSEEVIEQTARKVATALRRSGD